MEDSTIQQRRRDLGGFEVGRVLPFGRRRMVGPFIFFDHMGPVDFPPGIPRSVDVRPHPHIGLSTLSWLFAGEMMHRDSVGSAQPVRPGEVNWMTAGKGVTHSERFERARLEGGPMHGIQAWVALPDEDEECEPEFHHYGADAIPLLDGDGARGRLVAGSAFGLTSPVRTHSPLFYIHWELPAGARVALPAGVPERAAYVATGAIEADGQPISSGTMRLFSARAPAVLRALEPSTVMALGGEPLGERHIEWNFVSSSKERIEQAKADWRAGRMRLPDGDDQEFIPLPADGTPPNPMS